MSHIVAGVETEESPYTFFETESWSVELTRLPVVSADRLWRHHTELASIGALETGGIDRRAFSDADIAARNMLLGWARDRSFIVATDPIGNLFVKRPKAANVAPPILLGSHLDTQPAGGSFDGIFGVLAALEVLESLEDADIATQVPIELVVWANEEGSRFQPTTMGSAVFSSQMPISDAMEALDTDGVSFREALQTAMARVAVDEYREIGHPVGAYLETHIEQGPMLEAEKRTIGVVTGIQGLRWFTFEIMGEAGHAGTTPSARRKDALASAIGLIQHLHDVTSGEDDLLRFTVGRFEVYPNSPNTIPSRVLFTVDLRHPNNHVLARVGNQILDASWKLSTNCDVSVTETINSPATAFDERLIQYISDAATELGLPWMELTSGATHDAQHLAGVCPTAMIFIPCAGGISHSPAEQASHEDMAAGARVLAHVAMQLAKGH